MRWRETARDGRVTMGLWGLGLALFFLLLILAQAFPSFVLSPRGDHLRERRAQADLVSR